MSDRPSLTRDLWRVQATQALVQVLLIWISTWCALEGDTHIALLIGLVLVVSSWLITGSIVDVALTGDELIWALKRRISKLEDNAEEGDSA